jgi:hypothetical protein
MKRDFGFRIADFGFLWRSVFESEIRIPKSEIALPIPEANGTAGPQEGEDECETRFVRHRH